MVILYVAMKYDYGQAERGHSFEHYNFFDSLRQMGHDILYFDFMTLLQKHGKSRMNRRLKEVIRAEKPDLTFSCLFEDEFEQQTLRDISQSGDTITLNWFADDHWRFDNYSCHWAPCFNWAITTAQSALAKYEAIGYSNVLKSQWACNTFLYRKLELPLQFDVTFIGQPHGNRRQTIDALRSAGIDVHVWGGGWETGRLSQDEMIRVFNQSRINLNLPNSSSSGVSSNAGASSTSSSGPSQFSQVRRRAKHVLSRSAAVLPMGAQLKSLTKRGLSRLTTSTPVGASSPAPTLDTDQSYVEQIKGRNFEVPGCGGFLLTGPADNLEDYYNIDTEIACGANLGEFIEKTRYYLSHEDERAAIAKAGYARTLQEHTYVHRFNEIFQKLNLPCSSIQPSLNGRQPDGAVQEIN